MRQSVLNAGFPWLSGPHSRGWRMAARGAYIVLLGAGWALGDAGSAWKAPAALVLACAVLGQLAAGSQLYRTLRIWLAGLLLSPWLVVAVGNAALVYRIVVLSQGQAPLTSLLGWDLAAVLLFWPVLIAAACRVER